MQSDQPEASQTKENDPRSSQTDASPPNEKNEKKIDPESNSTEEAPPGEKFTFDEWYMKQLTARFADDLDALRQSEDFTDDSVPMLIECLQQCAEVHTEEEKRIVMED